jgi:hypothetical protein
MHGAAPPALNSSSGIDSQPFRAGLKFSGRPSGPSGFRFSINTNCRFLPSATPEFPIEIGGVGELHAAFPTESRTRGRW